MVFIEEKKNLGWQASTTRVVYLDLRAIEDQSYENGHLNDDELMIA